MKLTFVQSINEADISRGQRLLKLQEINKNIKSAVEAGGYSFKDASDKGFYIIPKNEFIAKIELDSISDENAFTAKIFDATGKEHEKLRTKILGDNFKNIMENAVIPGAFNLIFNLTSQDITKLRAAITEALPKFLQNAIDNIKNASDIKAAEKAQRAVDKINTKVSAGDFKVKVDQCKEIVDKAVSTMPGKTRDIQVNVTGKDGHIDILLISDVIAAVTYKTNYIASDKHLKVVSCITAISENKDLDASLVSFINILNRKLGLQIKIGDPDLLKFTGSSDKEIKQSTDFEAQLKNMLDDEILSKLGESLNEAIIKLDVKKYDDAIQSVKNDAQGQALVKLYFFKASGDKLKLNDSQAEDLWKNIRNVKSFAKDKSRLTAIFVNYFNKNQSSPDINEELKNLLTILIDDDFIDKLSQINTSSIIFNPSFIGNDVATAVTHDIYNRYTNVLNGVKKGIDGELKTKIQKAVPGIDIPGVSELTTSDEIANFMVFKDYKNKKAVRDIKDIKAIYDVLVNNILSGRPKPSIYSDNASKAPVETNIKSLSKEQVATLKNIFSLTQTEGPKAVDELISKLKDTTKPENQEIRKILAQILKQV